MRNYRNFTLVAYFVAHATSHVTEEQLEEQLGFILKHLRLDKVYLEPFRGEMASHEQVEMCKRVFERHGIQVAGGLTTVMPTPEGSHPKARLFNTLCYNDPAMRRKLKEVSTFIGAHFYEFIIDDFFFTNCMCADCVREKERFNRENGIEDGSWEAYRLDLMRRVSREDVIEPAKKANPGCRITIKYPNWAESYQETGYNPKAQRDMFDRIYTGTETRDPVTTDQHLPRYLSFSLMTYFENMWPGHNGGGWFDTFDTHITEHYLEQAYLTAFARPQEMMLFCFQSLLDNMYTPALGFQLDKLDAVLDSVGSPRGIACYLPDNCQGEDNVQDFLGMCGFPVVCTPYFPENEKQILLTRSSACDPQIVDKLKDWLEKTGGDALVTTGFLNAVKGMEALTSIRLRGRTVTVDAYRVEQTGRRHAYLYPAGVKPVALPVAEFRNNSTWAVVKGSHGEESYGLLLRDDYLDGHLWTLAVPDAFPDFYALPEPVLSRIRQAFPVEGVWLEGSARIGLFVYDNGSFILYPFVMEGVQRQLVRVHVKGASALRIPGKESMIQPLYREGEDAVFELEAVPGRFTVYQKA
ncbi:MAG: permease [Clostridia bacterium]|nr:permease [Clostridia bacterium]MBR6164785.1 permease [Clostridia bacterium]